MLRSENAPERKRRPPTAAVSAPAGTIPRALLICGVCPQIKTDSHQCI